MPEPEDLRRVRQRIADAPDAFLKIIGSRPFKKLFGGVTGDQLSRVPRGFSPDHPAAEYLRYRNFLAARSFPADIAEGPRFYKLVVETFKGMVPFVRFLNEPILQARRLKERQDELLGRPPTARWSV